MSGRPNTEVLADPATLARAVAESFEAVVQEASMTVTVALSGGSTPKRLYETLAVAPFRDRIPWQRLELFFGDERSVPPDHPDSNYGMTKKALFDHVAVTAHRMPAETGDAESYERLVRDRVVTTRDGIPVFDVVLLGIGGDGHTASLFPGTAALSERRRLVMMNDVPKLGTRRMTFTYPLLNAARRIWILAAGADKREVVSKCLTGTGDYPILGVQPVAGELVWWLDRAAA